MMNTSSNTTTQASFNIVMTTECKLFDFLNYTVVGGMFCGCGILGNFVAFLVLNKNLTNPTSKSYITWFLLRALTLADAFLSLTTIPLYVLQPITVIQPMHSRLVPILWPLYHIPYTCTVMFTLLLSFNRFMAACRPFSTSTYRSSSPTYKLFVYAIVVFSIVYNIPRFLEYTWAVQRDEKLNTTTYYFDLSQLGSSKWFRVIYCNILYFIVIHGGPLLALCVLNWKLISALNKQRHRKQALLNKNKCRPQTAQSRQNVFQDDVKSQATNDEHKIKNVRTKRLADVSMDGSSSHLNTPCHSKPSSQQQDLTRMLVMVVCAFILCHTPSFIDYILWTILDEKQRQCPKRFFYLTAVADTITMLNSATNFTIYLLTNITFRKDLLIYFGRPP